MDGRTARGLKSRKIVMKEAVNLASIEGLEGLSIGGLASRAALSKSGVAVLFGSKEQLQIATVEAAREVFIAAVVAPAFNAISGLARLQVLLDAWLSYSRDRVFPGGCFFSAASTELDSKAGPVREAVAKAVLEWHSLLAAEIQAAVDAGELLGADVNQLVFETTAFLEAANAHSLLTGSAEPYAAAKRALARIYGQS
ncbi:TetR/AcrR family transcriptional regulator [Arthrobacter sp. AL08]|uniref:TetR/AcrR family transcriptional regulator n=1 Tax=unclassified Arthrobacter TaxID=235627 RepID=UPI00249BF51A|nr:MULTISPECIES: TetR/AcrR family transcriptional regulator [unclassified Arthrobacter]MDI3243209.1 TetR/AcrR family transcriptional regulator [Arthrobacter sp. AL05]MDI3279219.1 TetR/AcrR family transcriptional regulator [Arthrobacter sp. AL08]